MSQASVPALLISAPRLRIYPLALLVLFLVYEATLIGLSSGHADKAGTPIGADFITFYAASKLTLAGEAAKAFDLGAIGAAEHAAVPRIDGIYQWAYPPTYQLLIAPLALMPYGMSLAVFLTLSIGAFAAAIGSVRQAAGYRLALICSPAVFLCVIDGQNSLLSAAAFAGGFALLKSRPFAAGLVFSMLAFKPQLGILLPLALITARQWRALAGAALGTSIFVAASTAVFGLDLWETFFNNLANVQNMVRDQRLPWPKLISPFVFARYLGVGEFGAFAFQGLVSLGAAGCVAFLWWRRGATPLSWGALICATLLISPYVFIYEFVLLLLPIVFLAYDMGQRGAGRGEKLLLVLPYTIGLVLPELVAATRVQFGFLIVLLTMSLIVKRSLPAGH